VSQWLAEQSGVGKFDLLLVNRLTAANTDEIIQFSQNRPMKDCKIVCINLDGASAGMFNRLLKLAEEPPKDFHLIFRASGRVPATLESRSYVVRLGALSDEDLMEILVDRLGWQPSKADSVISLAQGSLDGVQEALALLSQRDAVEVYLSALVKKDQALGAASLRGFRSDEDGRLALRLARVWCGEAVSRRWRVFNPESMPSELRQFSSDYVRVRQLYQVLCQAGHPRVVARAGLAVV
jgi:hypothetical protein